MPECCRPVQLAQITINMSGTLISSLAWVPRGRAALQPKKYQLDEAELERVGKLGGEGVLEQLKSQMAQMETEDGGEWEDVGEEDDEEDEEEADGEDADADAPMETDEPAKPTDPNDLSAYKMDEYDQEESKGVGEWYSTS